MLLRKYEVVKESNTAKTTAKTTDTATATATATAANIFVVTAKVHKLPLGSLWSSEASLQGISVGGVT